jgi:hypothetical protein
MHEHLYVVTFSVLPKAPRLYEVDTLRQLTWTHTGIVGLTKISGVNLGAGYRENIFFRVY